MINVRNNSDVPNLIHSPPPGVGKMIVERPLVNELRQRDTSDDMSYHKLCDGPNPHHGFFGIDDKAARHSVVRPHVKSGKAAQIDRTYRPMGVPAHYPRNSFRIEPQYVAHGSVTQISAEEGPNRRVFQVKQRQVRSPQEL